MTAALGTRSPHGTRSRYNNQGCRCQACREANRLDTAEDRARRRVALGSAEVEHGTKSTYTNHGCRCEECRVANAATCRAYRERRAVSR